MNQNINKIVTALWDKGYASYLVGGCVRDMLIKQKPKDYDVCTNAKPEEIIDVLETEQIFYHTLGIQYGTVVAQIGGEEIEITTYRKEQTYSDGRHPDKVTFSDSLEEDLSRRDFTINAIAYDIRKKKIIDPFHGAEDIKQGILRCVGDSEKRIQEDGLRILRALRFVVKYEMKIDDTLKDAIHKHINILDNISKERITDEMKKILTCGKPITSVFLEFSDVITYIIPEMASCVGFIQNNKYHKHNVYEHLLAVVDGCNTDKAEIKFAAFLHDIGKPDSYIEDEKGQGHFYGHPKVSRDISERVLKKDFRLTRAETEHILNLVEYHDEFIASTKKAVKRFITKHGIEFLNDWVILKQSDFKDHIHPEEKEQETVWYTDIPVVKALAKELLEEAVCFKMSDMAVNGKDLMDTYNLPSSPTIGEILHALFEAVLNETLPNEKEALLTSTIVMDILKRDSRCQTPGKKITREFHGRLSIPDTSAPQKSNEEDFIR